MGRTGRHKAGRVVYIMSQGKEEDSYRKGLLVSFYTFKPLFYTLHFHNSQKCHSYMITETCVAAEAGVSTHAYGMSVCS